jgi:DNA helicase HerA-like ATPase
MQQQTQMQMQMQQRQALFQRIALLPRGRGMIFGATGTGKSTLAERLIENFLETRSRPRVLILDGKPRFRGEWLLNGFSARRRYKKWQRGSVMSDSVVLDISGEPEAQLHAAWTLGAPVAIAQTDDPLLVQNLRGFARAFYKAAEDKNDQLLYADETADFFGTTGAASRGDALLQTVRSGRERNVSFLGGAQRPKGLPLSFLTELTQVYVHRLDNIADMKHLTDMGIPPVGLPDEEHAFLYYDKLKRQPSYYRLSAELARKG